MKGNFDPKKMAAQATKGQPQISKDIIQSAEDMTCLNEIPVMKEDDGVKKNEFMQCGGELFVDSYRLKYVSPIMSPTGQPTVAALMIGKLCVACGKIFNPDEWAKQKNKKLNDSILKEDKKADG